MKERPLIFSPQMVRAILDGKKTQTRRILRPQPNKRCVALPKVFGEAPFFEAYDVWGNPVDDAFPRGKEDRVSHPPIYTNIGDIYWVRETWAHGANGGFVYKADSGSESQRLGHCWRTPIHMPRNATRLFLTVTDIRLHRLQDISEADAKAEGVADIKAFVRLWDEINGGKAWDANPWVYAISFIPHRANLDQMAA